MPVSTSPSRRRRDHPTTAAVAQVAQSLAARLDAVAGGRLLLILSDAIVVAATPLLDATADDWYAVLAASALIVGLLVVSARLDWTQWGGQATLMFPLSVFVVLASLGLAAPDIAIAVTGLLSGTCVYTGLTQRPGISALVVPLGCATFVVMNGGPSHAVVIRMLVAAMVWTTTVEVLAQFSRRHERLTRALQMAALRDPLTGLANRRDLEARLAMARPGDALVVCDLDHFKTLNDTYGHRGGDSVLADFGTLLRLELRDDDYCARYGGEEFVLLLPHTSPSDALAVMRRLRSAWQTMSPQTTFSAGIALCQRGRAISETLAAADDALYAAKASGRNTDCVEPVIAAA